MPIAVSCGCGRSLRIKDELAGRKIRCPSCQGEVAVPRPQAAVDEDDVPVATVVEDAPAEPAARRMDTRQLKSGADTGIQPSRPTAPRRSLDSVDKLSSPGKRRDPSRRRGSRRSGSGLIVHREIVGGILMMVGAVVWLVVGLALGWLFYYPPILFVLGVIALIRGLTTLNAD
jgi:hypothetical protein